MELLLELAERGWGEWRDSLAARLAGAHGLRAADLAAEVGASIAALPLFCDLLTHVPLSLEGEVSVDRARRYKTNSFAAYDEIVATLTGAGALSAPQVRDLLTVTLALTANLWQLAHPTPTLADLYAQEPRWGHAALDFEPRLTRLLQATATGLTARPAGAG
ncbi:hypothetical protein [Asanoa siamensis]|uniref:Tetracyclin repressor-like C-terminal domain-containing protein n=1 Tax=Asanoa siamensis TaxID=926357 RepID=A0ABQ4CJX8_9ACTN|nr:hypothetical protein [Asanoa siamensis]GIF71598.1 hypothetical protein Asi02nite_11160 [Asanoa siamensis]